MDNMILGDNLQLRQEGVFASGAPPAGGSAASPTNLVAIGPDGKPTTAAVVLSAIAGPTPGTTPPASVVTVSATETPTASSAPAPAVSQSGSSGIGTTTLIAILVPVCVILAAVPTAAYLIYLRRRDRRKNEAELLRGRGAGSSSGATGEALLRDRSMSAASRHERKIASVSSEELELGTSGAALEKSLTNSSQRQKSDIFSPASHGPNSRRAPPTSVTTQPKPGFKPPPVASQSPTLPPLDFGKDDVAAFAPLSQPIVATSPASNTTTTTPPRPMVPAGLPTFAQTQPKQQRSPNPALVPGRQNAPSPSLAPAENPSWPLPASGLRDSASTQASTGATDRVPPVALNQNKPLPSALNKEMVPPTAAAVVAARQLQQQQQGPRESSIAYGMPPVPPSPEAEGGFAGDRRSATSRKRDSDAISELSYSASTRGRRDPRRDTDAISVISAMSQNDR